MSKSYFNFPMGVIGLGYVGLPLAIELCKKYKVHAYDKSKIRVNELTTNYDNTRQITKKNLIKAKNNISYSNNLQNLKNCKIFIIAVPTPVYKNNKPDLRNLKSASQNIATILKKMI